MKAVFIDAEHGKLENIEINFSGRCRLGEFYDKIGNGCQFVQAVPFDDENDLVCDEEVALRGEVRFGFRYIRNNEVVYDALGNAIVVGLGEEDWADTTTTAEDVSKKIKFFTF